MRDAVVRATSNLEDRHWWFVARRRILVRLVRELVPRQDSLVVDVGCGGGATTAALAEEHRCMGVDPSRQMIESARSKYPNVHLYQGSVEEAMSASGGRKADMLLLADVLEHVEDDRALLARAVDACRPGGACLITVPANPRLWGPHDEAHGHHRRYGKPQLRRLFSGLPVVPLLFSYFNSRLFPLIWMARHAESLLGWAPGVGGTDLVMPPRMVNRILMRIFAGEGQVLVRALDEPDREGYRWGASLVAAVRKTSR